MGKFDVLVFDLQKPIAIEVKFISEATVRKNIQRTLADLSLLAAKMVRFFVPNGSHTSVRADDSHHSLWLTSSLRKNNRKSLITILNNMHVFSPDREQVRARRWLRF